MPDIQLRDVEESDILIFYEQHRDPTARYMAAFAPPDPNNQAGFVAHWMKIWRDDAIFKKTILWDGQVAGHVLSFMMFGQQDVGYWLGKDFWGKGIATQALQLFLGEFAIRPLYARVVKDNIASRRVLEKCEFAIIGEDRGFAAARDAEVEEYILELK